MYERRRKMGRYFARGSNLPERLFVRRQNPNDFIIEDGEEILIEGKSRKAVWLKADPLGNGH